MYQNFVQYPFQALKVLVGLGIYSYCNIWGLQELLGIMQELLQYSRDVVNHL